MENFERQIILESQIQQEIIKDNGCTVTFKYETTFIRVFTYNTKTNEFFLLISMTHVQSNHSNAQKNINTLELILEYVKTHKSELNSYTVEWTKKTVISENRHKSYFYCTDVKQLIERFFEGKDPDAYVIYSITLNPIS